MACNVDGLWEYNEPTCRDNIEMVKAIMSAMINHHKFEHLLFYYNKLVNLVAGAGGSDPVRSGRQKSGARATAWTKSESQTNHQQNFYISVLDFSFESSVFQKRESG